MEINTINNTTNFNGGYTSRVSTGLQRLGNRVYGNNKNRFIQSMQPFYSAVKALPENCYVDIVQRGVVLKQPACRTILLNKERNFTMSVIRQITSKLRQIAKNIEKTTQSVIKSK